MGGQGSGGGLRAEEDTWEPDKGYEYWDRRKDETDAAWEAFIAYRNCALPRSLKKVSKILNKSVTAVAQWSRAYSWIKRVRAFDKERDRASVQAELEARKKAVTDMYERHLKVSTHMQRLSTVELLRWLHKVGGNVENPDITLEPQLNVNQIQTLLDYAIKLERLNRDHPEMIAEFRGSTELTEQELDKRIRHLLQINENTE